MFIAGVLYILFVVLVFAILKAGSDYDDYMGYDNL